MIDFSECAYIEDNMKFYSFMDFYENAIIIKRLFNKLTVNGKIFYKYYVYANLHISLQQKNKVWDYLNGYCEIESLRYYFEKKQNK